MVELEATAVAERQGVEELVAAAVALEADITAATEEAERVRLEGERERLRQQQEALRREREAQRKLRVIGVCVAGFNWIKQPGGYRCCAGGHWVSDAQIEATN